MAKGKKKRGIFRSLAGGTLKVGKVATKATVKATTTTAKVATNTAVYTTKVTAKASYITIKSGGKATIFAVKKAYPRMEGESRWRYRLRMSKLGVKIAWFTSEFTGVLPTSPILDQIRVVKDSVDVISTVKQIGDMTPRNSAPSTQYLPTPQLEQKNIQVINSPRLSINPPPPIPSGLITSLPDIPAPPPGFPPIPPGLSPSSIEEINKKFSKN